MSALIDTLIAQRDELLTSLDELVARDDFDPADDTYTQLRTRAEKITSQIEAADQADKLRANAAKITRSAASHTEKARTRSSDEPPATMGEAFVRSDAFTDYPGRGTSRVFTRALPSTLSDFSAALPQPARVDVNDRPDEFPLLQAINTITVSSNSVEYVKWADPVGAATKVAEGAAKPSIEFSPTVTSATLDTIAVWTHLTRQLLEDAPAVRSTIDGFLRYEVAKVLNTEAVSVLGAASLPSTVNADLLSAIRQAKGVVEAAGYMPNTVLLNPDDYAALDIAVMSNAGLSPQVQPTYWGLRPVASSDQAAGTALVGDFRAGMNHFTRGTVSLYISDSDQDDFIKNLFKLLAEQRSLFAVVRPAAFCETAAA